MNTFKFDSSWNKIKGQLKQKYAQLTDDDVRFVEGKATELLGRLQAKLGLSGEALDGMLNEMHGTATSFADGVRETVSGVVGDVKAKVSEATARVGEVVGEARAKVTEVAGDAYDHARDGARSLQVGVEKFVSDKPAQALLTAFAVGLVAGLLIRK